MRRAAWAVAAALLVPAAAAARTAESPGGGAAAGTSAPGSPVGVTAARVALLAPARAALAD